MRICPSRQDTPAGAFTAGESSLVARRAHNPEVGGSNPPPASVTTERVCGVIQDELPLSVRDWTCPDCGTHHDRDVNAAMNLKNLAASSAVTACGETSAGNGPAVAKLVSVKQELSCAS